MGGHRLGRLGHFGFAVAFFVFQFFEIFERGLRLPALERAVEADRDKRLAVRKKCSPGDGLLVDWMTVDTDYLLLARKHANAAGVEANQNTSDLGIDGE